MNERLSRQIQVIADDAEGRLLGLDRIDQATPLLDGSYTYPNGGHNNFGHQVRTARTDNATKIGYFHIQEG